METTVYERDSNYMPTDDAATLLVKLYSNYRFYSCEDEDRTIAIATVVRMLTD